MLVLRLLVMVLTIICLMDGHAEVSSSNTGIRDRRESPAVKTNDSEVEILDRKKKKKPKPGKKKKTKPGKKKKPNKAKPTPTKPVTTTPTVSTSTLKTTTILTTPTVTTTVTTTTKTVSTTTTATTAKTTTSTASATTTLSTTTTTVATSSTASTTITTVRTTATTSSLPTTAATTADSGAGGECKATNGKPCIFPFKDGKEYNACKNEGGKYFWCATSVYESGKYKHWSYCSTDGPCPLEGDGECRAENNKPCVFPFKDGNKEYNECADHGGKYFWCATGTNSAGKYTAWSECPKDGSCPLSEQGTTPAMTSTATPALTTTPTNGTSAAAIAIANVENTLNEINDTLQNLETAGFSEDEKQLLETMNELSDYLETSSLTRNWNYDPIKINSWTQQLYTTTANIKASKQVNPGFISAYQTTETKCSKVTQKAKLSQVNAGPGRMFQLHTISEILGIITNAPSSSVCCTECKALAVDTELFEHSSYQKQCDCYRTKWGVLPQTMASANLDSGVCSDEDGEEKLILVCPDGYSEKSDAPFLYLLKDWTYNEDAADAYESANKCATECKQNTKCDAVVSTVCKGCQLLTKEDSADSSREKVKHYCLHDSEPSTLVRTFIQTRLDKCPNEYPELQEWDQRCDKAITFKDNPSIEDCTGYCDVLYPDCEGFHYTKESCKTTNQKKECILLFTKPPMDGYLSLLNLENYDKNQHSKGEWFFCKRTCTKEWLEKYQGSSFSIPAWVQQNQGIISWNAMQKNTRIAYGKELDNKEWETWPWVASLEMTVFDENQGKKGKSRCGGTLISCEHILTARHCLINLNLKMLDPGDVKISLGSPTFFEGEIYEAETIYWKQRKKTDQEDIINDDETQKGLVNDQDIAIIKLTDKIDIRRNIYIRPILLSPEKLVPHSSNDENERSNDFYIVGWGYTEENIRSKMLKVTNMMKVRSGDKCKEYIDNKRKEYQEKDIADFFENHQICIERFDDARTLSADSGGPGMIRMKDGKWYLQAVESGDFFVGDDGLNHGFGAMISVESYRIQIQTILDGEKLAEDWHMKSKSQ